jgi:uncharacterized protein (DUF1697 family)
MGDDVPVKRGNRARPDTVVALLRGINVGGKNMLPMKDLAAIFVAAGCDNVATYIQSGNVVCSVPQERIAKLAGLVQAAILDRFRIDVPIVIRSATEMAALSASNPFVRGADPEELYVAFLKETPSSKATLALDPKRSPPDELAVIGKEVYLRLPNGAGRTKLTNAYLDKVLATVSTVRNWRTTLKLAELAAARDGAP